MRLLAPLLAVALLAPLGPLALAAAPPNPAPIGPATSSPAEPPARAPLDATTSLPSPLAGPARPEPDTLPSAEGRGLPEAVQAPANLLCGQVAAVQGDTLRLRGNDAPLYLDRDSRVLEAGQPVGREALEPGQSVRASFDQEGGRRVAHRVVLGGSCP